MGIGGSVIFSAKRGSDKSDGSENHYFTAWLLDLLSCLLYRG